MDKATQCDTERMEEQIEVGAIKKKRRWIFCPKKRGNYNELTKQRLYKQTRNKKLDMEEIDEFYPRCYTNEQIEVGAIKKKRRWIFCSKKRGDYNEQTKQRLYKQTRNNKLEEIDEFCTCCKTNQTRNNKLEEIDEFCTCCKTNEQIEVGAIKKKRRWIFCPKKRGNYNEQTKQRLYKQTRNKKLDKEETDEFYPRCYTNASLSELEHSTVEIEADKEQLTPEISNCSYETLLQSSQGSVYLEHQIEEEAMKRKRRRIFFPKKQRNYNEQTKKRLYKQTRNENEDEKERGEINKHVFLDLVAEMDTVEQKNEELNECLKERNKRLEGNESRTPGKRRSFSEDEPKVQKKEEKCSKMFSAGHGQNKTLPVFVSHAVLNELENSTVQLEADKKQLTPELSSCSYETLLQTWESDFLKDEPKVQKKEEKCSKMFSAGNGQNKTQPVFVSHAVLNELENSTVELEADKKQLTPELSNCSYETLLQNCQESVLSMKKPSVKDLELLISELSEEFERLSKEVTLARFLSDTCKFDASQRNDSDPYWFDSTDPAVSESMNSGVGKSNLETDDCFSGLFSGNVDQICHEQKVAVTVSSKGTQMLIPDTGVELYVPAGSLLSRQLLEIKIIDFDNDNFDAVFSLDRNLSVAVQLLPNEATLRWPARLRLPHCLRLKTNFQELKSHVKIYRSDHAPGQDVQWEHDPELKYELKEDCCIIFVKKFCSLRYDVIDEAIDSTNVTVFTAGKQHGNSMELAVGYHVDLPGRREMLLTMNNDMKIFKAKPFEFVKESTDPLQVHLTTAVSRANNYEKRTTEVDGKLSVAEAAAKIAELPLDRPNSLHYFEGNQHISTAILKVSETVSNKGTTMRILDTGIELAIPPNAFKGYRYIELRVVPFGTLDEPISTFSSNSSLIVELLPNRTTFSTPVRLSLPHCLKLKKGCNKDSVKVYLSHHVKDQTPFWEELPDAKYELKADHCVIYLTSFCWVKYEIDNTIVVAKRIRVYTATRGMGQNDQIAEVEVGYFLDMPGRAEHLRENADLKISQCKPLLFFKEGNQPLEFLLLKVLPMFWKYSTPDRNPKVIPFKSIADSVDTSLPFVFENQDASEQKPFVMFKVSQGNEEVEINIRL